MLCLNIPYLIIFINTLFGNNIFNSIYSLASFLIGFGIVFKTDVQKHSWFALNTCGYIPYDFVNANYSGVIANIIVVGINIINIIRIRIKGENKYYDTNK